MPNHPPSDGARLPPGSPWWRQPALGHRSTWVAVLVVLGVSLILVLGNRAWSAAGRVTRAQQLYRADPDAIPQVCAEVEAASAEAGYLVPVLSLASLLPGERWKAWGQVPHVANLGVAACGSLRIGTGLLEAAPPAVNEGAGAALLGVLERHPRQVRDLADHASSAAAALDRIEPEALRGDDRLAPLAPLLTQARARRGELRAGASLLRQADTLLPMLLGGDRPRTYLLVGQNNEEVRATGGFIGTLGILTLHRGQVMMTDVRSSYDWDNQSAQKLPAPAPLQRYMNFGAWYLRDANWWIDYRRTVAQLLLMWEREQGPSSGIDGVIAIDRVTLDLLLETLGGVDVPELGGRVTAANISQVLDERRRRPHAEYHQVKTEALSALHRALMRRVMTARGSDVLKVGAALARAAQERHLLLWFRDPVLQGMASERGWDGRVDPASDDIVGVVDSSLSYGKISPFVSKTYTYRRLPDGTSVVNVQYSNDFRPQPGFVFDPLVEGLWWDWRASLFRRDPGTWVGYVRVIAPAGSRLLDVAGWDDAPTTTAEGAVTVMGAPLLVRPGETRTASVRYANPVPLEAPLRVHRQPGTTYADGRIYIGQGRPTSNVAPPPGQRGAPSAVGTVLAW